MCIWKDINVFFSLFTFLYVLLQATINNWFFFYKFLSYCPTQSPAAFQLHFIQLDSLANLQRTFLLFFVVLRTLLFSLQIMFCFVSSFNCCNLIRCFYCLTQHFLSLVLSESDRRDTASIQCP